MSPGIIVVIAIFSLLGLLILLSIIISLVMVHTLSYPERFTRGYTHDVDVRKGFITKEVEAWERHPYTLMMKDGYLLHLEVLPYPKPTKKFVIITHGYTWDREGSRKYARVFRTLGYSCILYDLRSHGENVHKDVTMGYKEASDLHEIILDTYQRFGNDIELGLHGESLGAATSLLALRYHDPLKFVVSDCAFSDLRELCKHQLHLRHLPRFILPLCSLFLKLFHGYSYQDVRPLAAVKETDVPLLIFHGKEDNFIPPIEGEEIYKAVKPGTRKKMVLVEHAEHAQSYETDSGRYLEEVRSFLEKRE